MAHYAAWLVLGLIAGAIARWILPGEEKGGWLVTAILGILGALVGGWIAKTVGYLPPAEPGEWIPDLKSIASATVGSIVLLAVWKWIRR
ncbi:GlsB/YeaQ/YmgE family stress response membrane protein [Haloferula helveola]